jgi:hypothetical protein
MSHTTSSIANEDSGENMTINENENENTKLELFLKSVRNIVRSFGHSPFCALCSINRFGTLYRNTNNDY